MQKSHNDYTSIHFNSRSWQFDGKNNKHIEVDNLMVKTVEINYDKPLEHKSAECNIFMSC